MSILHRERAVEEDEARACEAREAGDPWRAPARRYGVATLLCVAFSAVYESLSHGVVSYWMVGVFAFPLVLGVLPCVAGGARGLRVSRLARQLWACGVMTLAMGSCLRGVLEIYGTSSPLVWPYLPVGCVLLVAAMLVQAIVREQTSRGCR